jgi:predicted nucleic acid-binding protein
LTHVYLESSAILKLYKAEAESEALAEYLANSRHNTWVSSDLTQLEVIGNLTKLGIPAAHAKQLFRSVLLVPVDSQIIQFGLDSMNCGLQALDAIHHATARIIGQELSAFVSYDSKLITAVQQIGIPTISPGANPVG